MQAQHLFHHRRTAQRAPHACLQNKYGTQPHTIQDTRQTSPHNHAARYRHNTLRPARGKYHRQADRPQSAKKNVKKFANHKRITTFATLYRAQMAESVDALVSNTSGFTSMPVRPRLWVRKEKPSIFKYLAFLFLYFSFVFMYNISINTQIIIINKKYR